MSTLLFVVLVLVFLVSVAGIVAAGSVLSERPPDARSGRRTRDHAVTHPDERGDLLPS